MIFRMGRKPKEQNPKNYGRDILVRMPTEVGDMLKDMLHDESKWFDGEGIPCNQEDVLATAILDFFRREMTARKKVLVRRFPELQQMRNRDLPAMPASPPAPHPASDKKAGDIVVDDDPQREGDGDNAVTEPERGPRRKPGSSSK